MKENQPSKAFGAAVRARREKMKVTQDRFADKIKMHRAYYSSLERGEKNITLRLMCRIAEGLGTRVSDIMVDAGL